jgi:GT2 family glycosyltransferase
VDLAQRLEIDRGGGVMPGVGMVVPSLADQALLERCLPPLLAEQARRGGIDRVLVVDDTGGGQLVSWIAAHWPGVEVLAQPTNTGFARAARASARRIEQDLLLLLNPDVVAREGFLDPLVAALADPKVYAVSPRVLLQGDPARIESSNALQWEEGRLRVRQRSGGNAGDTARPTAFGVGGALLMRRADFAARGFDRLFEPFYWEDVDLCLAAWRAGRRVVEVPNSIVEHHHRGSIGPRVPREIVHAAIEKNRWLLSWKYLDRQEEAEAQLSAAMGCLLDAAIRDDRRRLVELCLALEQLEELERSRQALPAPVRALAECLRASDPGV